MCYLADFGLSQFLSSRLLNHVRTFPYRKCYKKNPIHGIYVMDAGKVDKCVIKNRINTYDMLFNII